MSKHTPASWEITFRRVTKEGIFCCDITPNRGPQPYRGDVASIQSSETAVENGITAEEAEANANLIAAAPDLLTALQMALSALEWCDQQWAKSPQRGEGVNVLRFVRDAIAKAEGAP